MDIGQDFSLQVRRAQGSPLVDDLTFAHCPVSIALSDELRAVFVRRGKLVTHAELDALGVGSTSMWNLAAERTTSARVRIRGHVRGGIEVAADPGSAVDWLAHPHSFWLLHTHLQQFFGGTILYFAPTTTLLVAAPWAAGYLPELQLWAAETYAAAGARGLVPHGVIYHQGYPTSVSQQFAHAR